MPAFINDSICPNLKCNIKALDRAKAPIITEKEPVREPEKHLDVYKRQTFSKERHALPACSHRERMWSVPNGG